MRPHPRSITIFNSTSYFPGLGWRLSRGQDIKPERHGFCLLLQGTWSNGLPLMGHELGWCIQSALELGDEMSPRRGREGENMEHG